MHDQRFVDFNSVSKPLGSRLFPSCFQVQRTQETPGPKKRRAGGCGRGSGRAQRRRLAWGGGGGPGGGHLSTSGTGDRGSKRSPWGGCCRGPGGTEAHKGIPCQWRGRGRTVVSEGPTIWFSAKCRPEHQTITSKFTGCPPHWASVSHFSKKHLR